jgi:hypothetical protein
LEADRGAKFHVTRRLFGHPTNPRLIRGCVFTSLAIDAPASFRAGARLLGYQDLRVGKTHHNHATAASAQRRHLEVIDGARHRVAADTGEQPE